MFCFKYKTITHFIADEEMFMIDDPDTFFTSQQRALLTWSMMSSIQIKVVF